MAGAPRPSFCQQNNNHDYENASKTNNISAIFRPFLKTGFAHSTLQKVQMKRGENVVSKTTELFVNMLKPKPACSTYQKHKNKITKNTFSKTPATFMKAAE